MPQQSPQRGLRCPDCQQTRSRVLSTRRHRDGKVVRNRICLACGRRYVTTERVTG